MGICGSVPNDQIQPEYIAVGAAGTAMVGWPFGILAAPALSKYRYPDSEWACHIHAFLNGGVGGLIAKQVT